MPFSDLEGHEKDVVLQAMELLLEEESYIEDWEFQTRLGITRDELRQVLARWPNLDDTDEASDAFLAINNCLNEVCHGLDISPEDWRKYFKVSKAEVEKVYQHFGGKGLL